MTKRISIFGSTGSIGTTTIKAIKDAPIGTFEVLGLAANTNYIGLAQQAIDLDAKLVVIADETKYLALKDLLSGTNIKVASGLVGIQEMAALGNDLVMAAIVGSAGLLSTYYSILAGSNIALANKESLVCAGSIINDACVKHGATLVPTDSEHNAIFQVLEEGNKNAVEKIILTASGGPFRNFTTTQLQTVTKEQALKHPNWNMGVKITIDSATLFNKGLEIIEAHYLFQMPLEKIEVVVHPESIVHSTVSYKDGSMLAQMGNHDMKIPITHALYWPRRLENYSNISMQLDLIKLKTLTFEAPDYKKFPSLNLCRYACEIGGTATIVLNAANEIAVEYFLQDKIRFSDIFKLVERMLNSYEHHSVSSIEDVIHLDKEFKLKARGLLELV